MIPQPPELENQYYCVLASPSGLVKMALYPVIFGWRVRGWLTSEHACRIDWCGGADQTEIEFLYSILENILAQREDNENAFDGLPGVSRIKPFVRDQEFTQKILSEVKNPMELIKLPNLNQLRKEIFSECITPNSPLASILARAQKTE